MDAAADMHEEGEVNGYPSPALEIEHHTLW
jgi:hypothetical protein